MYCVSSDYARWCRSRHVPCNRCFLLEGNQVIDVWGAEIINQIKSYYKLTDGNRKMPCDKLHKLEIIIIHEVSMALTCCGLWTSICM